jgi:hypothetical protein
MKDYNSWLNETNYITRFVAPTSVENVEGGRLTPVGPFAENWIREKVRLEQYQKLASEIEESLKKRDDEKISDIITRAKDLPLFKEEQQTSWVKLPITGFQDSTRDIENRKSLVRYILNKIKAFESWCKEN